MCLINVRFAESRNTTGVTEIWKWYHLETNVRLNYHDFFFILHGKTYFRMIKRIECVDTSCEIYSLKKYVITYLRIKE